MGEHLTRTFTYNMGNVRIIWGKTSQTEQYTPQIPGAGLINQNVCLELSVTALRLYSVCSKQNTPKGGFPTINKIKVKEAWKII